MVLRQVELRSPNHHVFYQWTTRSSLEQSLSLESVLYPPLWSVSSHPGGCRGCLQLNVKTKALLLSTLLGALKSIRHIPISPAFGEQPALLAHSSAVQQKAWGGSPQAIGGCWLLGLCARLTGVLISEPSSPARFQPHVSLLHLLCRVAWAYIVPPHLLPCIPSLHAMYSFPECLPMSTAANPIQSRTLTHEFCCKTHAP